jgi:hypothetical protein
MEPSRKAWCGAKRDERMFSRGICRKSIHEDGNLVCIIHSYMEAVDIWKVGYVDTYVDLWIDMWIC